MARRTFIIDIDGCVVVRTGKSATTQWRCTAILPHVSDLFDTLAAEHACVVLMTARKESCRAGLELALSSAGLFWDLLVMGVGDGERVLVNDNRARAVEISHNEDWRHAL